MKTIVTNDLKKAAALLQAGQLVIFPTETVYGLGADATNDQAVAAIFEAKKRPADNPLIVHIWSVNQIAKLTHNLPDYAYKLIEAFFPGPFSLLLPKSDLIPTITTAGSSKICLRMPSLPLALELLKATDLPIAAPSANLSGRPSPTRWQDCLEDMDGRVAAILMGPEASYGLESTIVDASGASPTMLRPGAISFEELRKIVPDIQTFHGQPETITPGMKYRHYAPNARVKLIEANQMKGETSGSEVAYIGLGQPKTQVGYAYQATSLEDYARNLFAFFRECDRRGIEIIYAEQTDQTGIGRAIMNRLNKAVVG